MIKVYAIEEFPTKMNKSIFLAGPSPRGKDQENWREDALRLLEEENYEGHVFIPLPRDGKFPSDYNAQADWEQTAMNRSDIVLFWVPRDLKTLPAFTTNIEFGQKCKGRNVVLGYPPKAPKCKFLSYLAENNFITESDTLEDTIKNALQKIGKGFNRYGGECEVPLYLWNLQHFQSWMLAQKSVGNRLDGCKVELCFGVGPKKAFLLYWGAHVDIYVKAEDRNKDNEIVIGRPDIKHTVGFTPSETYNVLDANVVLIKEFRSTAVTTDGFIREIPGGSSFKPVEPKVDAAKEFFEETGIELSTDRLGSLGARQLCGTTTTHKAHVFYVLLTPEELELAREKAKKEIVYGNVYETELTYVEVKTLRELIEQPLTDWANLGMIFTALVENIDI